MVIPDPALLVRGLDRLVSKIFQDGKQYSSSSFRMATFKLERQLDYKPTENGVLDFAQLILGELEAALLALPPATTTRVAAVQNSPEGEAGDKGRARTRASRPSPAGSGMTARDAVLEPAAALRMTLLDQDIAGFVVRVSTSSRLAPLQAQALLEHLVLIRPRGETASRACKIKVRLSSSQSQRSSQRRKVRRMRCERRRRAARIRSFRRRRRRPQ